MVSGGKMWSKMLAQRRCGRTWLPIPSRGVSPPGQAQGSGTASLLLHDPLAGEAQRRHANFWGEGGYSGGAWKDDNVRGPKLELLLVALLGPIRSPVRASVFLSIKWEWWRISSPLAHSYVIVHPGEG